MGLDHGIATQLERLRGLKDGWYDGQGHAPKAEEWDWLGESLQAHYPYALTKPRIYPVVEGGASLEWTIGRYDASLEIDLGSHAAYWHVLHLDTREDEERRLNLDSEGDWSWVVERLGSLESRGGS